MSIDRYLAVLCIVCLGITSATDAKKETFLKSKVEAYDEWDYSDGPNGPAHWADLDPDWEACSKGQSQSPINIDTSKLVYDEKLNAPVVHDYYDAPAYVLNTGHAAEVIWPAGSLYVNGKNYTMTGFEFHSPSEHTIDGKSYPLEMQIVHMTEDGDYAMVVVLSSLGPTNWWAEKFWHLIPSLDSIWQPKPVGIISPGGFRVNFSKYYRYIGSLTSPDCQENVVWTILSTVYEISEEQIDHLRSLLPEPNNRPIQPLGDRQVSYPKASA